MQKLCPFLPVCRSMVVYFLLFHVIFPEVGLQAQQNNPLINSGAVIARGVELHDSGEYKKAIDQYLQINRNDTNYVHALYELSVTYAADSQFNKALQCCRKGLDLGTDPAREPDLYNQYGNILDAMNQGDKAIEVFDSAIRKYPAYSLLYLNKGTTLLGQKKYREAEGVFKQALLIDPYSYSSHYKLAIAALQQGKLVPAFLSFVGYLLVNPQGRYRGSCIQLLNAISHNEDNIQQFVNNRKETPSDNYLVLEQILQSKIALDNSYKPLIKLDDPISRQIQVVFEKMEYNESDNDFWVQYYMPYFRNIFTSGSLEVFVNHCFSGVDLPVIQDYIKRNKKQISTLVEEAANYFSNIRATRELNAMKRNTNTSGWLFSDNQLYGRGKYLNEGSTLLGPWEFYYPAGNLKAKGTFNDQGKKEGQWVFYYFSGKLKGKEFYQNGLQQGEESYYFQNGMPSTHSYYKDNQEDGESTTYFYTGIPSEVTHYQAGKEDGKKNTYYSGGQVSYEDNYTGGIANGPSLSWYQNGQLEYSTAQVNGKLEGPYKKYYDNGQLADEGNYVKDKQDGTWKHYYSNGQLKGIENYVDGKQEGDYKEYYDDGKLMTSYTYRKGKINGEALNYDHDGKIFSSLTFENDQLKTAKYFDKSGKRISQSDKQSSGMLDLVVFDPDGIKKYTCRYDAKSNASGPKTYYYPTGEISETDEYKDGDLDGPSVSYYPNGHKKEENNYKAGKRDGYHQVYFNHGQVQEEGWYVEGKAQGFWLIHDELGALLDSAYYLNNDYSNYRVEFSPNGKKEYESRYRTGWLEELIQYDSTGRELQHLHFEGGSGKYLLVYPNGKPYIETAYLHGSLDGPRRAYYVDGTKLLEEYYKRGALDSTWKNYFHNGQLSQEGSYHLGTRTGTWKYYWINGALNSQESYKDGKLNGLKTYYNNEGKLESEVMYKNDETNGTSKNYDPDGTLSYQMEFEEGKPVSYTWLDKDGKLLPAISLQGGTGNIRTWFPNGKPSAVFSYRDGQLNGPDTLYFTNGNIRRISVLDNGKTEGAYKTFHPNGHLKNDYVYLHDNLHGYYHEYNDKGILTEEGTYYNGSPNGYVKVYDQQGNLKETDFYYFGKLLSVNK